jgi:hypothetical protein
VGHLGDGGKAIGTIVIGIKKGVVPAGSGGKRCGSATDVTAHLPRSGSVKVRPMRSVPSGVG